MDRPLMSLDRIEDRAPLEALLREYYATVLPRLEAVGGPALAVEDHISKLWDGIAQYLPPAGRIFVAEDPRHGLVGCGFLRRIGPAEGEMRRLYVMPEVQGIGLGRRMVEARIDAAREMGLDRVFADTVRGNTPMLSLYRSLGFNECARYPGNGNPPELEPHLVYLERSVRGAG